MSGYDQHKIELNQWKKADKNTQNFAFSEVAYTNDHEFRLRLTEENGSSLNIIE